MANLPWLEEMRERLVIHGLPSTYIQRFLEELGDHFHDLKEETMSTEADVCSRLGEPAQVAEAAVVAYRRRSFLGRHPTAAFLVFAVSPLASFILLFAVFGSVYGTLCEGLNLTERTDDWPSSAVLTVLSNVGAIVSIVIPSILLSLVYCRVARRFGLPRKWAVVACVVLATIASTPCYCVRPGYLCVNVWLPLSMGHLAWFLQSVINPIQLLIPLAFCWWFMRHKFDQGQFQLAS